MYDIISIGSATRDVFLSAKDFKTVKNSDFSTGEAICFSLGSKVEVEKIVSTMGGGGANAAITFARQGLKTAAISAIGNDQSGKDIIEQLNQEGVDTQYFQKHGDDLTAYSTILVGENAERTILSYKGEGQHFDVNQVPFDQLQTKWLYLDSLGGHYDLLEKAVQWAAANNVKLATTPGGKELAHGLEKLRPLLKYFSIVIMNQEEATALTGIDFNPPAGGEEKIFKFMDDVIGGIFIMTKGPEGAVASDGKQIYSAGIPNSPIVERTGAGDAFSAGFISEYIRSGDIAKAIQIGTANASSVVTQYGAIAGILKKGDVGPWRLVEISQN